MPASSGGGGGNKVVVERDGQRARTKVLLTRRPQMSKLLSNGLRFRLGAPTGVGSAGKLPSGVCLRGAQCVRSTQRGGGATLPPFLAGGFTPEEEAAADHNLCRGATPHFPLFAVHATADREPYCLAVNLQLTKRKKAHLD